MCMHAQALSAVSCTRSQVENWDEDMREAFRIINSRFSPVVQATCSFSRWDVFGVPR